MPKSTIKTMRMHFFRWLCLTGVVVLMLVAIITTAELVDRGYGTDNSLQIDLGYSIYEGYPIGNGVNAWDGIRYAAPPTGENRWRAPQTPVTNRSAVIPANSSPNHCPQSINAPLLSNILYEGDEDCLFLSITAPDNCDDVPVLVYIHGGGYGSGDASANFSDFFRVFGDSFVTVSIQYRLEAFGFLSSVSVHNDGVLNAGLLDQHFALEWVQDHISKFGGDPDAVTIAGESAGGGSVQMQAMAYGGSEGTTFFSQGIAASPYTPAMYSYDDAVPAAAFSKLASAVDCVPSSETSALPTQIAADSGILDCLRQADSSTLQTANYDVGGSGVYGTWLFVPVVDGEFIQQRPSLQLTSQYVNGARILTSNNADEGASFVDPSIRTEQDFENWLRSEYPMLTPNDISQITNVQYPLKNESTIPFATCGDCNGPTAVDVGSFAVGNWQRAINFYSEATFDCPSLWLAAAYQGTGYKYQFSVPSAYHGEDLSAESIFMYPNLFSANIGPDMNIALTTSWGNFVMTGDPSISGLLANGNSTGNKTASAASAWPPLTTSGTTWPMLNWNQSGGTPYRFSMGPYLNATQLGEPGLRNAISLVDANSWEGGRGARCAFLQSIGSRIPL